MTIEELKDSIRSTAWFSNLGHYQVESHAVSLPNLDDWRTSGFGNGDSSSKIVRNMIWLPTSRDASDPIYGDALKEIAVQNGLTHPLMETVKEIYRETLISLRPLTDHPMLRLGPDDLTEAAKGAALFAVKQAATEIVVGREGFWSDLMPIYFNGNWPCGLMPDKTVVVLGYEDTRPAFCRTGVYCSR